MFMMGEKLGNLQKCRDSVTSQSWFMDANSLSLGLVTSQPDRRTGGTCGIVQVEKFDWLEKVPLECLEHGHWPAKHGLFLVVRGLKQSAWAPPETLAAPALHTTFTQKVVDPAYHSYSRLTLAGSCGSCQA